MKQMIKFMGACGVLILMGCSKQPTNNEQQEVKNVQTPMMTIQMCDDPSLKNRVVALVQDELTAKALIDLADTHTEQLAQHLLSRLSYVQLDIQNVQVTDKGCFSQLHIVLPDVDVLFANKAYANKGKADLQQQAIDNKVSLMGGNRLVADFLYSQHNQELMIEKDTANLSLASDALAQSAILTAWQNHANAKRETKAIGKPKLHIKPPPTVTPTPVVLPEIPLDGQQTNISEATTHESFNDKVAQGDKIPTTHTPDKPNPTPNLSEQTVRTIRLSTQSQDSNSEKLTDE